MFLDRNRCLLNGPVHAWIGLLRFLLGPEVKNRDDLAEIVLYTLNQLNSAFIEAFLTIEVDIVTGSDVMV